MSEQITQLEATIKDLKSRILDTQDFAETVKQQAQELSVALTHIAQAVGVEPNEHGHVALESIVDVVKALVADNVPAE